MAMNYSKFNHSHDIYPYFMGVVEYVIKAVKDGDFTAEEGIKKLQEEAAAANEALDNLPFLS